MPDNSWDNINELADDALDHPKEEPAAFPDEPRSEDNGLGREVDSLRSSFEAYSFEDPPTGDIGAGDLTGYPEGQKLGHYELIRKLGEGGMGVIYLAKDLQLDRHVAIKVLSKRYERSEDSIRRFIREAKAASALNHPNILTIYEIGEFDGSQYIVSEYVKGQTLRHVLNHRKLDLQKIVDIAGQIASALAAAHEARIIHRDIKPENVIVRGDGYVKVLDFGLAKLLPEPAALKRDSGHPTQANSTASGIIMGTVSYMSPEQARGKKVDERTDIFSLGVVVYEMVAGKAPFTGDSIPDTFANLLRKQPEPLLGISEGFQRIVSKMLEKDPGARYSSVAELMSDLGIHHDDDDDDFALRFRASDKSIANDADTKAMNPHPTGENLAVTGQRVTGRGRLKVAAGVAVMLAALIAGGAWIRNRSNVNWAAAQIPLVEELSRTGKRFEAYDLALEVRKYVPADPRLMEVTPSITDSISVTTEPAGASIYLKRYQPDENGKFPERQLVGTTPVSQLSIPRGPQILYIEKEGFAPVQRSILGNVVTVATDLSFNSPPIEVDLRLIEASAVPENMVFVPGGEYRLVSSLRPTDEKVRLDDFFIDKFEVSNKDYKEFITAGGYLRPEYWRVPVVKDGRTLSWSDAMELFRDRSSLPGPREWSNQDFPQGREEHPVTGISWYEAAAYAEFRGKKLPTVFQWEKASRDGQRSLPTGYMPWGVFPAGDSLKLRANFDDSGTLPVNSGEFGISPFGAFNTAGNVSEWALNEGSDGFFATGGGWGEPSYTYSYFGVYPGLFQSDRRGFRCVLLAAPDRASGDQGGAGVRRDQTVINFQRTTEAQFNEIARVYDYEKTPLDAQIVDVNETPDWRREKITFNGAGGQRAIAYLYLPNNAPRPLQVIQLVPGSDVDDAETSVPRSTESWLGPVIKSGRAVLSVVAKGNIERPRPAGFMKPNEATAEYVDLLVDRYTDHRRGLDYLETRTDIDMSRAAFAGISAGASQGLVLAAIEKRYLAVFLIAAGLRRAGMTFAPPANAINFAPHIRPPKYVLNGRFDEAFPVKTSVEPMMKLFSEPKQLQLFDGPHAPPMEVLVPAINKFLAKTLGPMDRR